MSTDIGILLALTFWALILLAVAEVFRRARAFILRRPYYPLRLSHWLWHIATYFRRRQDRAQPLDVDDDRSPALRHLTSTSLGKASQAMVLHRLAYMSPTTFEETVAALMRQRGFIHVRRVGGAGDLAVDIQADDQAGRRVAVQCKRYADQPVRSGEMQQFIGMAFTHHQCDRGIYVAASRYTPAARALGEKHNIELIDGYTLARLLIDQDPAAPHLRSGAEALAAISDTDHAFLVQAGIQPPGTSLVRREAEAMRRHAQLISDAADAADAAGHVGEVVVHVPDAHVELLETLAGDGSEWAADELARIEDHLFDEEEDAHVEW